MEREDGWDDFAVKSVHGSGMRAQNDMFLAGAHSWPTRRLSGLTNNPSDMGWLRGERVRSAARFALLGAGAGSLFSAFVAIDWVRGSSFDWVAPGLIFGLVVGTALWRLGLADLWRWGGFVAASTASHYAAVWLAIEVLHSLFDENMLLVGSVAGLVGSTYLTLASALLFRFVRRVFPCLMLVFAGSTLGALLGVGGSFWEVFVLYAGWQAGYAATLSLALPSRYAGTAARIR